MTADIEAGAYREAMSRFAASVHVLTTDGPAGRRGTTITSACSVSDRPPTLLVCVNAANPANARFAANGCFALNVLGRRGEALARAFAGEGALTADERFARGAWAARATEAPSLEGALVAFDCRVIDARIVATHCVLVGEVLSLTIGPADEALLYHGRRYHRL